MSKNRLIELIEELAILEQDLRDAVNEIKKEAKSQGKEKVQEFLENNDSTEAKEMIDEMERLNDISLTVDIHKVSTFVARMLKLNLPEAKLDNKESGIQFVKQSEEKADVKVLMGTKGFSYVDSVEDKMKFKKGENFYFAIEFEDEISPRLVESTLQEASKYSNLVLLTQSEKSNSDLKQLVANWVEDNADDNMRKYLTIQLGSYEKLKEQGTVLERMITS